MIFQDFQDYNFSFNKKILSILSNPVNPVYRFFMILVFENR